MMIGGLASICVGSIIFIILMKRPKNFHEYKDVIDLKGYGAALAFIVLGVVMILDYYGLI
jgi:hypothetical protein